MTKQSEAASRPYEIGESKRMKDPVHAALVAEETKRLESEAASSSQPELGTCKGGPFSHSPNVPHEESSLCKDWRAASRPVERPQQVSPEQLPHNQEEPCMQPIGLTTCGYPRAHHIHNDKAGMSFHEFVSAAGSAAPATPAEERRKKYPEGPGTIPPQVVVGPLPDVLPDLVPKAWDAAPATPEKYDEKGICKLCGWPESIGCHHPASQLAELSAAPAQPSVSFEVTQ
jgi:hypothetical protein